MQATASYTLAWVGGHMFMLNEQSFLSLHAFERWDVACPLQTSTKLEHSQKLNP